MAFKFFTEIVDNRQNIITKEGNHGKDADLFSPGI